MIYDLAVVAAVANTDPYRRRSLIASHFGVTLAVASRLINQARLAGHELVGRPAEPIRHGTRVGYVRGCRCPDCRHAHTTYHRPSQARAKTAPQPDLTLVASTLTAATDDNRRWVDDAKCHDLDLDLFFPSDGDSQGARRARAICTGTDGTGRCPVLAECLQWALHHERYGIWGGTSEKQRRRMRRTLRTVVAS